MTRSFVKIKGAGIKGLTLAYFLRQKGISSVIYELSHRAGGWIKTVRTADFMFETGPRGFRPSPLVLDLIKSCGLENDMLLPDAAAKKRFIYAEGKLNPIWTYAPLLIGGLIKDFFLPKTRQEETVQDYFSRRMGAKFTSHLIDPLTSGIFAGDIKLLSAQKCFPSMTNKGSVLKSMWSQPKYPLITFKYGMESLVERLLEGQEVIYNVDETTCDFDCTPDKDLPSVSVVSVNVGWKKERLPVKGFGYLVPQTEKSDILGVVFDSSAFPAQSKTAEEVRVTVMLGGAHRPDIINFSDVEIELLVKEHLVKHLNISQLPDLILINRAPRAIPQPYIGSPLTGVGVTHAIESAARLASIVI